MLNGIIFLLWQLGGCGFGGTRLCFRTILTAQGTLSLISSQEQLKSKVLANRKSERQWYELINGYNGTLLPRESLN